MMDKESGTRLKQKLFYDDWISPSLLNDFETLDFSKFFLQLTGLAVLLGADS